MMKTAQIPTRAVITKPAAEQEPQPATNRLTQKVAASPRVTAQQQNLAQLQGQDTDRRPATQNALAPHAESLVQRNPDPVEEAALDQDKKKLKADVDAAMLKIKLKIAYMVTSAPGIAKALKGFGRDWYAYAPLVGLRSNLGQLLLAWNPSWTIEQTSGLLIDIGIAMRTFSAQGAQGLQLINAFMQESRQSSKRVNSESEWAQSLPHGTKTQAGASASTANLLLMLEMLKVNTPHEIEAIMNGVVMYWKNTAIKQMLGDFHTAAEVWAVYNQYLLLKLAKQPSSEPQSPPKVKIQSKL